MKIKVPFYKQNSAMDCGPTALKMALEFLGEKHEVKELEELAGIKEGKAVFTHMLALASAKLGFKTKFYTKFIGANPANLNLDFYKKHADSSDIANAELVLSKAKSLGVDINEKIITLAEIIKNIKEDRVMILILDWNVLTGKEGFQGHFVPIVGYDSENMFIHNQGFNSPKPYLAIKKELFERARKSQGTDEDILILYKK